MPLLLAGWLLYRSPRRGNRGATLVFLLMIAALLGLHVAERFGLGEVLTFLLFWLAGFGRL